MIRSSSALVEKVALRAIMLAVVAVIAATLLVVITADRPAYAATSFTVNSTGDDGDNDTSDNQCFTGANNLQGKKICTLRGAIQQANATSGTDTINFAIPDFDAGCAEFSDVCTISPSSGLPTITEAVTISGYSQLGASPNTLANGNNAVLKVELSGSHPNSGFWGLVINTSNSTVRGLVINRWDSTGVFINGPGSSRNKVQGNFIGTDATGTQALGNYTGVFTNAPNNTIGGTTPSTRNLISGNNGSYGVGIGGPDATGNKVQGNFIGTDVTGSRNLRNLGQGINIGSASGNTIGGGAGARNVIAFNKFNGLRLDSAATRNRILSNSIHSNVKIGIDLLDPSGSSGVTKNDLKDPDRGGNNLQNFPVLSFAATTTSGTKTTTIEGRLNSTPEKTFTVQFFSSPKADPSGFGEGKKYLGQKKVTANAKGNISFTFKPAQAVKTGHFVTATATNAGGNTSEFSRAREVLALS